MKRFTNKLRQGLTVLMLMAGVYALIHHTTSVFQDRLIDLQKPLVVNLKDSKAESLLSSFGEDVCTEKHGDTTHVYKGWEHGFGCDVIVSQYEAMPKRRLIAKIIQ